LPKTIKDKGQISRTSKINFDLYLFDRSQAGKTVVNDKDETIITSGRKTFFLEKTKSLTSKSIQLITLEIPDDLLLLNELIQIVLTPFIYSTNVKDLNFGKLSVKCEELDVITVTSIPNLAHSSDK